ncbi:MAG: hypothetical protein ACKO85_21035 [Isosphaeraceae bacterium]
MRIPARPALLNYFLLISASAIPLFARQVIPQPTLQQIVAGHRDVISDYAISLPAGPSYKALLPLMPPSRWVVTDFRHYPVVLSAPAAPVKARIASNGSALNPLANNPPTWKEAGRELKIAIGADQEIFGQDLTRLGEGHWLDGYKPVWVVDYISRSGSKWQLQVFAPVSPDLASQGALCFEIRHISGPAEPVALTLASQNNADQLFTNEQKKIATKPEAKPATKKTARPTPLSNNPDHWLKRAKSLVPNTSSPLRFISLLQPGQSTSGLLLTKPSSLEYVVEFQLLRTSCINSWQALLDQGPRWHFPEELIEDAWRAHLISIHMTMAGNKPNYSAMNAYDHLYMTEGSDTLRSLAYWGQFDLLKSVADAQFAFMRTDTRTSVAGMKLSLARDLAEITGDSSLFTSQEMRWAQARDFILHNLDEKHGLPPADRYAGDLGGAVLNLRSSSVCWRGLRDLARALETSGRTDEANTIRQKAETLRQNIIRALEESEKLYKDADFVPIGFFGKDEPVARIPDTQLSSYYNLIMGNVLDSGILNADREAKVVRYLENRAGLSMGLPRTRPFWPNSPYFGQDGVAPLYGLRYSFLRLRRNQPDHALVTFYGWLAHGMSRQGFVHGEGVRYTGGDSAGRYFHLPPNATSAANWLTLLRHLAIAEWDTNNDATYDTLRLLDSTPPAWLEDKKYIELANVPTRFGKASIRAESRLASGQVLVSFDLPENRPEAATTIRFRLPKPYKARELQSGDKKIMPDSDGRFAVGTLPKKASAVLYVENKE